MPEPTPLHEPVVVEPDTEKPEGEGDEEDE